MDAAKSNTEIVAALDALTETLKAQRLST
jgi:hypothetical protein